MADVGGRRRGAPVYTPAVQVMLTKLVTRRDGDAARYSGADRQVDLTPMLGDGGAVQTMKGLTDAAGGFSITFPDRPLKQSKDSAYSFIEPMDVIEIRAARHPHRYAGQKLPLIMRGFVSQVRRAESMGADGEPQRRVIVAGQDAGKLWQIFQLVPEALYASLDMPYLDTYRLQASEGLEIAWQPAAHFMRDLTERVVNKRLRDLAAFARRQDDANAANRDGVLRTFRVEATVAQGIVSALQIAPFQGPFWALAEMVADRPWNELFIEDEEEGPLLRFRPSPYRDLQRRYIMPGAVDPGTVELDADFVRSVEWVRTDSRVANFFFVPPGASMLDSGLRVTIAAVIAGTPFDRDNPNNARELYGLRKMQMQTMLLPETIVDLPARRPLEDRERTVGEMRHWHEIRMEQLKAMNRDNSVLEEGEATVLGHEFLKIGRYLALTRGRLVSESYITRVAHTFAPLSTWTTNLTLERSTGFLERNRYEGLPFWAEGIKGPYDA